MDLHEIMDDAVVEADDRVRTAAGTSDDELAELIIELSRLPKLDYEQRRKAVAEQHGLTLKALDAVVAATRRADGGDQERITHREELIGIAHDECEFWRDANDNGYATLSASGHFENHAIRSGTFKRWLLKRFGDLNTVKLASGKTVPAAPGSQAVTEAIHALDAYAGRGPLDTPFLRVGWAEGCVYVDSGDADWTVYKIDAAGWGVCEQPPVKFIRAPGLLSLPEPTQGGTVDKLTKALGIDAEASRLVIAFMCGCLMPGGPYPILAISGEHGSGKSTLMRKIRALTDPNAAPIRPRPKTEDDLIIAARNGLIVALDNLSHIDADMSDSLCRVATGASLGKRTLYTDLDETLVSVCRPQMINGIPELAGRPDLADRCISVALKARPGEAIEYEADMWQKFDRVAGDLVGLLFTATSMALARLDRVVLKDRPRMADFARWVEAAAPTFGWQEGQFLAEYMDNRATGLTATLDSDLLARHLAAFVGRLETGKWEGMASGLLDRLAESASDDDKRARDWPKRADKLSARLARLAPALRKSGIDVSITRNNKGAVVYIARIDSDDGQNLASRASPASPISKNQQVGRDATSPAMAPSDATAFRPGNCSDGKNHRGDASDANFPHETEQPRARRKVVAL